MSEASSETLGWWRSLVPNLTAFFASAAIMVLELVAGRLVATYLGMSLYTWTTIIGVMMGGIALGNYLGGRLADRVPLLRGLGILFLLAGLGALLILPLNNALGRWTLLWQLSWPLRILIHVGLTFAGPAMLLGMINPLVAKLALQLRTRQGAAVGGVFAAGVLGSILGTFFTGYYLLLVQGVGEIAVGSAIVLGALGLPYLLASRRFTITTPREAAAAHPENFAPPRGTLFYANATVFFSNAAFMIIELAAARVLSREFGASLYTWTTVIGVVLAGITFGNALGGRLADRAASRRVLAAAFLLASITALLAPRLAMSMGALLASVPMLMLLSWPLQILFYMVGAFFLPNLFLGMISPLVVKRCLDRGIASGRTVGDIYAWGAVGAITGTFLAGYWLIDWLWPLPLIALTATALAAVAVLHVPRGALGWFWLIVSLMLVTASLLPIPQSQTFAQRFGLRVPPYSDQIYEDESQYSYIAVTHEPDDPSMREFLLDRLTHSRINLEAPAELHYEYEWVYEAVLNKFYPPGEPISTMVIGGGGYAFPHYLEVTRPESYVEVSEIDPAVTEAAHAAFGLPRDTSIAIYNMDARNRIADLIERKRQGQETPEFDLIFGDSINDYTVPFHLTTLEFAEQLDALLKEDGIYMLNLIDMYSSGGFLGAVTNTLRRVFPFVYVFNTGRPPIVRDTFIVIASKRALNVVGLAEAISAKHTEYQGNLISPDALGELITKHKGIILTDNYAPVENLLTPVVRSRRQDPGEVHFSRAKMFAERGQMLRAMEDAQRALEYHPKWAEVHEFMAGIHSQQGNIDGAIRHLREAIAHHKRPAVGQYNLGMFFMNNERLEEAYAEFKAAADLEPTYWDAQVQAAKLALALQKPGESIQYWKRAVAIAPEDANAHYNLGLAHAAELQYDEAAREWRETLTRQPEHLNAMHNLVMAYISLGDTGRAWHFVNLLRDRGEEIDPILIATLRQMTEKERQ